MKKQHILGLTILIINIIVYIFYPSPLLLITIAALATVLLIKSGLLAGRKKQSGTKTVRTGQRKPKKKRKS